MLLRFLHHLDGFFAVRWRDDKSLLEGAQRGEFIDGLGLFWSAAGLKQHPLRHFHLDITDRHELYLGLRALSEAMPDRIPAGSYGDQMPTIAFGAHPETGRLFIQGDLNAGGAGGRPAYDATRGFYLAKGYTVAATIPDLYAPGDAQVILTKRFTPSQV